jgi:beta-glucosidase
MADNGAVRFPPNFTWGTATSAYQIEGAWNEDERGPSIWDTFCHQRGHVHADETGDTAADHYHRWAEDIEMMSAMGLKAYRFSIAWTRIIPAGAGPVNKAGLDFYERLIDGLLAKGITPYPTLFHYDLPQPLQDRGGWPKRDTAQRFGDYASVLADRLGDRVDHWITHNEPWVTAFLGYFNGTHAPGLHNPFATVAAIHHLLLSHGYAVQALRAGARRQIQVGIALNLSPVYPASPSPRDAEAARFVDGLVNRIILDPLLKGHYPADITQGWLWRCLERGLGRRPRDLIQAEDLKIIATPLDFVGVNYYSRAMVRYLPLLQAMQVRPNDGEYSEMWEIYPPGLYDLLTRLHADYGHANLIVSENGIPVPDVVSDDGRVHDAGRVNYLRAHITQLRRAMDAGVPVTGYFVWSQLDNFEWVYGYTKRFGFVYVDFETKQRIMKDGGWWYAQVIHENGLPPADQDRITCSRK